jgi:hypothetical protein
MSTSPPISPVLSPGTFPTPLKHRRTPSQASIHHHQPTPETMISSAPVPRRRNLEDDKDLLELDAFSSPQDAASSADAFDDGSPGLTQRDKKAMVLLIALCEIYDSFTVTRLGRCVGTDGVDWQTYCKASLSDLPLGPSRTSSEQNCLILRSESSPCRLILTLSSCSGRRSSTRTFAKSEPFTRIILLAPEHVG